MRAYLLQNTQLTGAVVALDDNNFKPYSYLREESDIATSLQQTQEGLGIKTYQSDIFNNWMNTEWIDGANGITELTKMPVVDDAITIDVMLINKKVYDMMNRLAISGGTYKDWVEVQFDEEVYMSATSPVYMGGMSRELVFQEVISNSGSSGNGGEQPLGTLASRIVTGKQIGRAHV